DRHLSALYQRSDLAPKTGQPPHFPPTPPCPPLIRGQGGRGWFPAACPPKGTTWPAPDEPASSTAPAADSKYWPASTPTAWPAKPSSTPPPSPPPKNSPSGPPDAAPTPTPPS